MSQSEAEERIKHPFDLGESEKHEGVDQNEDDEEEEEALSLCDLPVTSIGKQEAESKEEGSQTGNDSDFDFGSLIGSISALESEMCAADEVFSGGQMLPFRHSVSCDAGPSGFRVPTRSVSRSESMDRVGLGSRSTSSRSSSTRSQQSASSTTSSGSSGSMVIPKTHKTDRNNFHSYPSPKPQIRASGTRNINCSGSKSTMWQVLRLGLVRTPEIELQDVKERRRNSNFNNKDFTIVNRTTRSDSINSSSSNESSKHTRKQRPKIGDLMLQNKQKKQTLIPNEINRNGGGIFGNCKCSVGAIDPIINMSPRSTRTNYGSKPRINGQKNKLLSRDDRLALLNEDEHKVMSQKQKEEDQKQQEQRRREKAVVVQQGKRVASHHRTFEWLRDVSETNVLNS